MKKFALVLMLGVAAIAGSASEPRIVWPKFLTASAGGVDLEAYPIPLRSLRDPGSGFFRLVTGDCDGAHLALTITRDRAIMRNLGFEMVDDDDDNAFGVREKPFAERTSNGIAIGMTQQQVIAKIGPPTKSTISGNRKQFRNFIYEGTVMTDRENGATLRNEYIFKANKLIEINISRDSIPGC